MAIVIWWMEVVYIHWVMVANQESGVSSRVLRTEYIYILTMNFYPLRWFIQGIQYEEP